MTETKPRSMADLAKDALAVQDASNLTGVVHTFSRVMAELRMLEPGKDTFFYNTHPIAILFASKITALTSCELGLEFSRAYKFCTDLSEKKPH